MIHVTLSGFFVLFLFLLVGGVAVMWIMGEAARLKEARRFKKGRMLCRVCGVIYDDPTDNPLPVCPVCHHANERTGFQQI